MESNLDLADFLQRFSTKVLWHFTGYKKPEEDSFKILCSIMQSRILQISEHKPIIQMPSRKQRWGYKCSCMCDIPFKDLRIHTVRYGNFGIAFHKPNAIKNGRFNPVLYIQKDHYLLEYAESLIEKLEKQACRNTELDENLEKFLTLLGTYVKRGDLLSKIHLDAKIDEEQNNNFYYEREWRSASDWNFKEDDVVAVMLPKRRVNDFKTQLGSRYSEVSVITSEMIEVL